VVKTDAVPDGPPETIIRVAAATRRDVVEQSAGTAAGSVP
jgi:hypothetical protein